MEFLFSDCKNKRDDCESNYGQSICTGKWKGWAAVNCAKMCGLGDCQEQKKGSVWPLSKIKTPISLIKLRSYYSLS